MLREGAHLRRTSDTPFFRSNKGGYHVAVIVTSHQSLYISASPPRFALFSLRDFRVSLLLLFALELSTSNKIR